MCLPPYLRVDRSLVAWDTWRVSEDQMPVLAGDLARTRKKKQGLGLRGLNMSLSLNPTATGAKSGDNFHLTFYFVIMQKLHISYSVAFALLR